MQPDRDVAAAAALLVDRHGDEAGLRARRRVARLRAPRDARARALWIDVIRAIDALQGGQREAA